MRPFRWFCWDCEVAWRGEIGSGCWICGALGEPIGAILDASGEPIPESEILRHGCVST